MVLLGLVLVPFPGPGWLIVILGLLILASEFTWAQRLLDFVRDKVRAWTEWMKRQSLAVRMAVGLATAAFVGAVLYGVALLLGVPSWIPGQIVPPLPGPRGVQHLVLNGSSLRRRSDWSAAPPIRYHRHSTTAVPSSGD